MGLVQMRYDQHWQTQYCHLEIQKAVLRDKTPLVSQTSTSSREQSLGNYWYCSNQELTEMKPVASKASTLYLTVQTWEKDSHGLFDFEATKLHKENYQIQGPCKLYRNWQTAQTCAVANESIKRGHLPDENFSFHATIALKHNGNFEQFMLSPPERPGQQIYRKNPTDQVGPLNTNTYVIVRFFKGDRKTTGYPMKTGNIIKLGRVEFKVVEIGGTKAKGKKQESFLKEFQGVHKVTEKIEGACKFCLCDEVSDENPMISPCNCKGSCEVVHVECLKMWINSKVKKQVSGVVSTYNFTKFECELCKVPFPRKVINGTHEIQMLEIEKPMRPYLILESLNERNQSKEERCLHLLCPEEGGVIKMGRGHQCEIRLQDISVSRMHSEIKYSDGQFYLTDENSKFGTLVRLDKTIELNHRVKLQAGRSIYEFSIQ